MRVLPFDSNQKTMSGNALVELISEKFPRHVQIDVLKRTFPHGTTRGDEFSIGSLYGESGKSLKIGMKPRSADFMKGQESNVGIGGGGKVENRKAVRGRRKTGDKEVEEEDREERER